MRSPAKGDDAGASPARSTCRSGSRSGSAPLVKGRHAGASPACGPGRVAQRTEPIPSKDRDAGSNPAASFVPPWSTGQDGGPRSRRRRFDSARGRRACGVMDSTARFERASRGSTPRVPARQASVLRRAPKSANRPWPLGSAAMMRTALRNPSGRVESQQRLATLLEGSAATIR